MTTSPHSTQAGAARLEYTPLPPAQWPTVVERLAPLGSRSAFVRALLQPRHPRADRPTAYAAGPPADPAGVVVRKPGGGRGTAGVILLDPAAATTTARLLERLDLRWAGGPEPDMRPVVAASAPRADVVLSANTVPLIAVPAMGLSELPQDPRTRRATSRDVPAVLALMEATGFGRPSDPAEAGRDIGRSIDLGLVMVATHGDAIVAVAAGSGWSEDYAWMDVVAVHPDHRHEGLPMAVGVRLTERLAELGVGCCGLYSQSNTMRQHGQQAEAAGYEPWTLLQWRVPSGVRSTEPPSPTSISLR